MYTNPVLALPSIDHGDPAILRYLGEYYLYHTGQFDVAVYCSEDLVHWEKLGTALRASDEPGHWAGIDLWAPEVIYADGRFYMYVTGALRVNGKADDNVRRIGVAVADRPEGPFTLSPEPLTTEWSIDAHPFQDSDGSWYMYYNVRNSATLGPHGVIGCGNYVDKMIDFQTLQNKPTLVCKPEFHWEGNLERTWYWNEGPFTIKRLGQYYQMYSGGCFFQPTYHVGYAVSQEAQGRYVKWPDGVSQPILESNSEVWGPGHHVVTKGPNGIQDYVVYHGRVGPGAKRSAFIDPLYWHGDRMYVDGPTARRRTYLPEAQVRWKAWQVTKTEFLVDVPRQNYFWEFWLHADAEGTIYLAHDRQNAAVQLDPEAKTISMGEEQESVPGMYSTGWNHFVVLRSGSVLSLTINGTLAWQGSHELGPTCVGATSSNGIEFRGVSFTPFFRDSFTCQPADKGSSALVTHSLKTTLRDWETMGSFAILDYGVQGNAATNKLRRSFSADDFHLEFDFRNTAILVELECSSQPVSLAFSCFNESEWQHVSIKRCGEEVVAYQNGKQITRGELPTGDHLSSVTLTVEKEGIVNNISLTELFWERI